MDLTARNTRIAKRYAKNAMLLARGILLSGSNAYGPNHAVTPQSDIDLLIVVEDVDSLGKLVRRYVGDRLLDRTEEKRFRIFKKSYQEGKAEQFSIIAKHRGVNVSLDFLTFTSVKDITCFHRMKRRKLDKAYVRVIREFRTNPPKPTGYRLDSLDGKTHLTYHPRFSAVNGGYIAETLVDGRSSSYCLGVMSFFLCIHPRILWEKEGFLTGSIDELRTRIARLQGKREIKYITRQERMPREVLQEIKRSLSQEHHNL